MTQKEDQHNYLASETTFNKIHGSEFKSSDKEQVPISIKKTTDKKSNYYVVVGEHGSEEPLTKYESIDIASEKPVSPKIDYVTGFYIGSLTVVGLFVFYRLLNKTK
jgi:hypothetical protein